MKNLLENLQLYFPKVIIRQEDDPLVEALLHRLELNEIPVEYQQIIIRELRTVLSELNLEQEVPEEPAADVSEEAPEEPPDTPEASEDETAELEATDDTEQEESSEPSESSEEASETEETELEEQSDEPITLEMLLQNILTQVQEVCPADEAMATHREAYLKTVLQTAAQFIFGDAIPSEAQVTQCLTVVERTLQDMAENVEKPEFSWVYVGEDIAKILEIVKTHLMGMIEAPSEPEDAVPTET